MNIIIKRILSHVHLVNYFNLLQWFQSMLSDSYNAVKQNTRRLGYESDETDNISVSIEHTFFAALIN